MENNIGKVRGYRDIELKKFRKVTQLDAEAHYFLTIVLNEDGTFDKYSFDVNVDGAVFYEFDRDGEKELKKLLRVFSPWEKIETVLIQYLAQHSGAELESIVQQVAVKNNNCICLQS